MYKAAHAYLQTQVTTTSQGDILLLLYEGAIKFLKKAKDKIAERDYAGKGILISKAIDVISELDASLNAQKGGDLADNLHKLYFYCNTRLLNANLKMDVSYIDEVIKILSGLREAYLQIMQAAPGQTTGQPPADAAQPETPARPAQAYPTAGPLAAYDLARPAPPPATPTAAAAAPTPPSRAAQPQPQARPAPTYPAGAPHPGAQARPAQAYASGTSRPLHGLARPAPRPAAPTAAAAATPPAKPAQPQPQAAQPDVPAAPKQDEQTAAPSPAPAAPAPQPVSPAAARALAGSKAYRNMASNLAAAGK